jgi:hypothetical protein
MYNRPHRHHMWCANAWVGAPWACGEARYDESVENYEHQKVMKVSMKTIVPLPALVPAATRTSIVVLTQPRPNGGPKSAKIAVA